MSEASPLVSVIIPAYNYADFLNGSIGSVLGQTHRNIECIIVDDGSTDNTRQVVEEWIKKDNRVKYFYQEKSGPTVARNRGIKEAGGGYIQFLDADDLLEAEKLEKQLEIFSSHTSVSLVYGKAKYFDSDYPDVFYDSFDLQNSGKKLPCVSGKGDDIICTLLRENCMVISSPLTKKALFEKHGAMDETLLFNEDWELWLRFAVNNEEFICHNAVGAHALIRVHSSYSRDNLKMFIYGLRVCLKYFPLLKEKKFRKILVPKIAWHKKVIDRGLLKILRIDRKSCLEKNAEVYLLTGLFRYRFYSGFLKWSPAWLAALVVFCITAFVKLKTMVVYG